MAERAKVTTRRTPRLARARCAALVGATCWLCGSAAPGPAVAQTLEPWLLNPYPESDLRYQPSFRKRPGDQTVAPSRIGRLPTYGLTPRSGAGSTGYNATNAAPRKPAAPGQPPAPKPFVAPPLPPADASVHPEIPGEVAAARRGAPPIAVVPEGDFAAEPAPPARRKKAAPLLDPFDPVGIRAGSFILKPAIELTGGYDTNPGQTSPAQGSKVFIVAPELKAQSDWSRHELRADLRGTYTDYPDLDAQPSLNRPYFNGKVNGRIDVTRQTRIDTEGRLVVSTDNPSSPNLPAGLAKLPLFANPGATVGVAHQFNRLELGASGTVDRTVYQNSTLTDGSTVSNRSRNYDQYGLQLRGSYELTPGVKPFVEIAIDRRKHDEAVDPFGFQRDSVGRQARIGTTFELTRQLAGSISVGYLQRAYADPTLLDLSGIIADGSLVWTATGLTTVTFTARSSADESTVPGVSGALTRDVGVQVDHALRRWLIATFKLGYGLDDYVGSDRVDTRYFASAALTYKLSREVQLKGEIRRDWRRSNVAGSDYADSTFLLGIRLQR